MFRNDFGTQEVVKSDSTSLTSSTFNYDYDRPKIRILSRLSLAGYFHGSSYFFQRVEQDSPWKSSVEMAVDPRLLEQHPLLMGIIRR